MYSKDWHIADAYSRSHIFKSFLSLLHFRIEKMAIFLFCYCYENYNGIASYYIVLHRKILFLQSKCHCTYLHGYGIMYKRHNNTTYYCIHLYCSFNWNINMYQTIFHAVSVRVTTSECRTHIFLAFFVCILLNSEWDIWMVSVQNVFIFLLLKDKYSLFKL